MDRDDGAWGLMALMKKAVVQREREMGKEVKDEVKREGGWTRERENETSGKGDIEEWKGVGQEE
ncbi:hypothetical protein C0995_005589 [Termitomyces sp. Mi166|nr:hypothetical protein C0995_005589 [Termitomyces sp. Mi166\